MDHPVQAMASRGGVRTYVDMIDRHVDRSAAAATAVSDVKTREMSSR
jgi:hypothetical protein